MNIDPVINSALTVLNGSMLLCLVIVITTGRRAMRRRSCRRKAVVTLLKDGRECWRFCRLLSVTGNGYQLPPLTKEDRL